MNGIATFIHEPHKSQVEALWQELEEKCGLIGVRITPFPHFTYQVVETYDQAQLEIILQEIAHQTQPFMVQTTGLGVFTGDVPVIYLPLVKNETLLDFHKLVWERTEKIAQGFSSHYAPEFWIPHITLAYGDVTPFNLGCAMEALSFKSLDWKIQVDNLTFIGQNGQSIDGNCCTFQFGA